jgi:hypothetical protein
MLAEVQTRNEHPKLSLEIPFQEVRFSRERQQIKIELRQYYLRLEKLADYLLKSFCGTSAGIVLSNQAPDAWDGVIMGNGGIAFETREGMPAGFHTPLGRLPIVDKIPPCARSRRDTIHSSGLREVHNRFSLVEVSPSVGINEGIGLYMLTRDLTGQTLPEIVRVTLPHHEARKWLRSLWNEVKPNSRLSLEIEPRSTILDTTFTSGQLRFVK